jgi:hypothetical protein
VRPVYFAVFKLMNSSELCRLLHWQIPRLGSLQDLVHVICYAPIAVDALAP